MIKQNYEDLIKSFQKMGYQTVSADIISPEKPHLLLRHDVDIELKYALEIAKIEKACNVHSTFFVLVTSDFYNALSEGGKIFIEIPNDIENKNFNMPHTLFFEVEGLTKLFKDNKFKIISISNVNKKQLVQSNSIVQKEGGSKISSDISYLIIKSLPDCFVQYIRNLNNQKYYNSNSIIHNGPYDQRPFIRLIVEK